MPDPRHLLGQRGEEIAAAWLTARGWTILARRWRSPVGELDLVALAPDGTLVGVEVKLRRSDRAGRPEESLDRRRLARLRHALAQFRDVPGLTHAAAMRIDLVAIRGAADEHWHLAHHPGIDAW